MLVDAIASGRVAANSAVNPAANRGE
jgi:hypothetical protein